jgi:prophage antirepressor-like protein
MSTILPAGVLEQPPAFLDLTFEAHRMRFVGTPENPEWVASDVCDVLGIVNVSQALAGFDSDEKGIRNLYTLGGKQTLLTVYEPGLYKLLFKSKKPEAKRFQKWVTNEVLPSIRKYGIYPPPESAPYELTLKPYTARVVWVMQVRRAMRPGYWCVFVEGADILIAAECILGPANLEMKQYDLLDGSIGSHWSRYRQGKPWEGRRIPYDYTFPKGDPRGTVKPWSYPGQELPHFKHWLHSEYLAIHMPAYLESKYGKVNYQRALPLFAQMGVPMLADPSRAKKKLKKGEQTNHLAS